MKNVSEAMRTRIQAELDRIESENGVRILLAIESGSRAWGFPSPDSDYDVRFLYLRPRRDYLSVFDRREVIERPLDAVLDINGWDIKKALRLMTGSNAVVLEWLTSPLRYRADKTAAVRLLQAAREVAHLPAYAYHYDRLARRSLSEITLADTARLKAYCYCLRACLALAWIRECEAPPPMDLSSLLAGTSVSRELRRAIDQLVATKATATERDVTPRIALLDALFDETLRRPEARAEELDRSAAEARIDELFQALALSDSVS
jgi:predicted nucleotidyltransferase